MVRVFLLTKKIKIITASEPLASGVLSQLTIHQVKMNDSGEYLCLPENIAGKAVESILLTMQLSGFKYTSSSLTSPPCPGCAWHGPWPGYTGLHQQAG